jgi:hypothetical protein
MSDLLLTDIPDFLDYVSLLRERLTDGLAAATAIATMGGDPDPDSVPDAYVLKSALTVLVSDARAAAPDMAMLCAEAPTWACLLLLDAVKCPSKMAAVVTIARSFAEVDLSRFMPLATAWQPQPLKFPKPNTSSFDDVGLCDRLILSAIVLCRRYVIYTTSVFRSMEYVKLPAAVAGLVAGIENHFTYQGKHLIEHLVLGTGPQCYQQIFDALDAPDFKQSVMCICGDAFLTGFSNRQRLVLHASSWWGSGLCDYSKMPMTPANARHVPEVGEVMMEYVAFARKRVAERIDKRRKERLSAMLREVLASESVCRAYRRSVAFDSTQCAWLLYDPAFETLMDDVCHDVSGCFMVIEGAVFGERVRYGRWMRGTACTIDEHLVFLREQDAVTKKDADALRAAVVGEDLAQT